MTTKKDKPLLNRTLFDWVLRGKRLYQILLLVAILSIVFLRIVPLEIQKRLVNDVLASGDMSRLFMYCMVYLGAVLLASGLKFVINGLQTLIGEHATADMRREMYRHILSLPLAFFRKTQPGTVVTSLVNELATTGTFVGVAVAIPLVNILSLVAFAGYLIWLNPLLGLVTLSVYPFVLVVVPKVQRRVDKANKKRIDASRALSTQVTESISIVQEIHAQGAFRLEEQKYETIVDRLLRIRIIWTLSKYAVKTTNNLFLGLGPVLVFLVGGYLMMRGEIELGVIVAFLSAQEKVYEPSRELTKFYQVYQDATVRYKKIIQAFDRKSELRLDRQADESSSFIGKIEVRNLDFTTPEGLNLLNQVNITVEAGEHVALVGFSGSGKSTLAKCMGQLVRHTGGEVLLGGHFVDELSKEDIISNIGFISQEPSILTGTVNDNLLYSCNAMAQYPGSSDRLIEPTLDDKIAVLQQPGIFIDILRLGLNTVLDEKTHPELAQTLLRVRGNFQENFGDTLAKHVEFFREDRYLYHSNIKDNIVFGTTLLDDFAFCNLAENIPFAQFLDECQLSLPLLETGATLLLETVSILGDVPREHMFFTQTPIKAEEYDSCLALSEVLQKTSPSDLAKEEQYLLIDIALNYIPALHKIVALQPLLKALILNGRQSFRTWCEDNHQDAVAFYSDTRYIGSQSILNNIFFGSLTSESPKVEERVNQCVVQLLVQEDLLERIAEIGMDFHVGNNGDKLSGGQKQKLAIARVLMKQPSVLIMDEATSALDNTSQARIQKVVEQWKGTRTVISVIHRLDMLPSFDKVAVLKDGKIIEYGTFDELVANKGALHELIHGKQY